MKVTFRWLDYEGGNKVWEEVIFRHWGDHVPRKTEVIYLDGFKGGKHVKHQGVIEEVSWYLSRSEGGYITADVIIQLGRMN